MASTQAPRIANISVAGLFGAFNYDLPGPSGGPLGETVILYGDNGCGKTTLLQLVFHMLSPADNRGHRNSIAKIPFKTFTLTMTDGTVLTAARTDDALIGAYEIRASSADGRAVTYPFDPATSDRGPRTRDRAQYLSILESLGLLVYLVSDERTISSDTLPSLQHEQRKLAEQYRMSLPLSVSQAKVSAIRNSPLDQTISMVNRWIFRQAARGANEGDNNVNSIYAEIIRRLATASPPPPQRINRHEVTATLRTLADRSELFATYRLVSPLKAETIIELVTHAPDNAIPTIAHVLTPYIDSMRARLDALDNVQRIASIFVTSFADFYTHKTVRFDVVDGLRVYSENGRVLEPKQLSSGERQLLRLLCYTLVSRDAPSVFIIDEPELSLNIKWQRKLIDSLNTLVEGTNNQFLFATHSMEILAKHRRAVVQLKPTTYQDGPQEVTYREE